MRRGVKKTEAVWKYAERECGQHILIPWQYYINTNTWKYDLTFTCMSICTEGITSKTRTCVSFVGVVTNMLAFINTSRTFICEKMICRENHWHICLIIINTFNVAYEDKQELSESRGTNIRFFVVKMEHNSQMDTYNPYLQCTLHSF